MTRLSALAFTITLLLYLGAAYTGAHDAERLAADRER